MNRWLAGHLLWPVMERLCRRDTMRRLRRLRRSERFSAEQLLDLQQRKLRRLLKLAALHCPFYARRFREAGLDPCDPHLALADLGRLPVLTRQDIRANLVAMTWQGCPRGGAVPFTTGGSTGEPLQFYIDRHRQAADWAARWRARSWWGVCPGDREILLWGAPIELHARDRLRQRRDTLLNQRLLDAFDMSAETMDAYVREIQSFRPACVYGYGSSLALLARHALQRGATAGSLGSRRLRAVFVTGEVLSDTDREAIESAFQAPVAIEYGSRDGGLLACACPAGRLHVPQENVILELLDPQGRPVPPGEVGDVVVTPLEAFAMPVIRYRIGDLARAPGHADGPAICPCGRALASLAEVRGRATDQVVCKRNGRLVYMHALSLIYVLREAEGVCRFRITQPSLDRLIVDVVADERFTPDVQGRVEHGLRERMGNGVAVHIRRCDRIPPGPSGKHTCVVSQVR